MASVADQLRRIANRTNEDLETVVKRTNVQLFTSIVLKTPVKDGYLQGAWVAQTNGEPYEETDRIDKTGAIVLNAANAVNGSLKIGDEFWFVNAMPYATYVENGTDRQQAQGMVKLSVRDVPSIVKREAARV